jgi:hypothetical protein
MFVLDFKLVNTLKSIYFYLKRWKVMTLYLDGSRGIYTTWTLSFSKKGKTKNPFASGDINERQIYFTYH